MVKKFFISFLLLSSLFASAQINEIGITVGGSNYIGDIGPENYINPNSYAIGAVYKYNLNPRIALRGNFTYFDIKSDDANSSNVGRQERGLYFTNTILELAGGVEFSWFEYDLSTQEKTHTPYILLQVAVMNYNIVDEQISSDEYTYKTINSVAIPFGLGYKTKLFGKFALGAEIGVRYTIKDDIDYNNFYIPELSFGNPQNNDWYVFSGINLVYTFGRPPCYATRSY